MSKSRILRPNIFAGSSLSVSGGTTPSFWDTFTGDDFTGTNGDPLSTTVWTDQAAGFEWLIQSNKANVNITTGSDSEAKSISTFSLTGDFDIQIDFDSLVFTNSGFLRLYVFNGDLSDGAYIGTAFDSSVHSFNGNTKVDNVWGSSSSPARTNDNGGIRIVRSSANITLKTKDGGGVYTDVFTRSVTTDDVVVWLQAKTGAAAGDRVSGNFDNFLINSGTVVAPSVDYTKLLLHMDGVDNGTVFTDSSAQGHTVNRFNAVTKTAVKVFGTASGYFDGSGDYLSIPDSTDWNFGTGDFTVDFRVRIANLDIAYMLFSHFEDANNRGGMFFSQQANVGLKFNYFSGGVEQSGYSMETTDAGWVVNTWYHVALVRNGNRFDIYRDGVSLVNATSATAIPTLTGALEIGAYDSSASWLNGYIDEFRVSKGTARWTENFTPPSGPYS
jgi:hypothetical protein